MAQDRRGSFEAEPWSSLLAETCGYLGLELEEAPSELALASLISRGLPVRAVGNLLQVGVPDEDIFRSVISRRTFIRRKAEEQALSPEESDRAERFARVLALATAVFGDRQRALQWLEAGHRTFAGRRPLDLIASSVGTKVVEDALLQAYYGNVG
jgi:putative toxin-antitoxin system antitoxin component (TIGR02293 family)